MTWHDYNHLATRADHPLFNWPVFQRPFQVRTGPTRFFLQTKRSSTNIKVMRWSIVIFSAEGSQWSAEKNHSDITFTIFDFLFHRITTLQLLEDRYAKYPTQGNLLHRWSKVLTCQSTDTRHIFSLFPLPNWPVLNMRCTVFFCNVDWCTVFLKFFYLTTL